MIEIRITPEGQDDIDALPFTIQVRVDHALARLREWPNVSGAKPLKREWKGHFRIRTGDYRIIFRAIAPSVLVVRVKHRSEVYEDQEDIMAATKVTIEGAQYVILPVAEYDQLRGKTSGMPDDTVDAVAFVRGRIAAGLKAAREAAGLTQEQLAAKLDKSQPMVSGAERGTIRIGEGYAKSVRKACGLPADWKPGPPTKRRRALAKSADPVSRIGTEKRRSG